MQVITFPSVSHAFRAERLLKAKGLSVKLVAIPRELSGSCDGLAAQVQESQADEAVRLLEENGVLMLLKGVLLADGRYLE